MLRLPGSQTRLNNLIPENIHDRTGQFAGIGGIPGIHFLDDLPTGRILESLDPCLFKGRKCGGGSFSPGRRGFRQLPVDGIFHGNGGIHAEKECGLVVRAGLLPHVARQLRNGISAPGRLFLRARSRSAGHERQGKQQTYYTFSHVTDSFVSNDDVKRLDAGRRQRKKRDGSRHRLLSGAQEAARLQGGDPFGKNLDATALQRHIKRIRPQSLIS